MEIESISNLSLWRDNLNSVAFNAFKFCIYNQYNEIHLQFSNRILLGILELWHIVAWLFVGPSLTISVFYKDYRFIAPYSTVLAFESGTSAGPFVFLTKNSPLVALESVLVTITHFRWTLDFCPKHYLCSYHAEYEIVTGFQIL